MYEVPFPINFFIFFSQEKSAVLKEFWRSFFTKVLFLQGIIIIIMMNSFYRRSGC